MSILNRTLEYTSISITGATYTIISSCLCVLFWTEHSRLDLTSFEYIHIYSSRHMTWMTDRRILFSPFLHADQNIISSRNTTQNTFTYSDWATMTNNAAMTRLLLRTRLPCGSQPNRGRRQPRFKRLYIPRALRYGATSLRLIRHLCGFLLLPFRLLVG